MVISQLPTDTAGIATLWRLIEGLSHATEGVSPESTGGDGFEFALKALVVLLTLLVLAIFFVGGVAIYFLRRWDRGQREGIKALSANKDAAKREIVGVLEKQLSASDAATNAANNELRGAIKSLNASYNLIRLDLVVLAQKCKVSLMSLPSHKPTNQENFPPNQE